MWVCDRTEVLREFASKRHVKLSRVTVRAKDEDGDQAKPAAKHRRRRASSGGDGGAAGKRKESDRSLSKVRHALHDHSFRYPEH